MEHEEVVIDEAIPIEEEIEPFDWEDFLYESWMEERGGKRGRGRLKLVPQSKRRSKSEHEPSSHSPASRCSPRTGTAIPHCSDVTSSAATSPSKR